MIYALALLLLIACFTVSDTLLELKIKKLEKEIIAKESVIGTFATLDKAISKLNTSFKDHERRIDNIERTLVIIGKFEKPEEPEKPDQLEYTCKDCDYYRGLYGNYYMCKQTGCFCSTECDTPCDVFKKKESLDEDENVVYANNVKIDISSKDPHVIYKTDRILTYEECVDRISKLFLDGGIGVATMNVLLERLKQ